MEFLQNIDLKKKIFRKLSNSHFLKNQNISQEIIDKHINSSTFLYSLQEILEDKDFSPSRTLNLCASLLNEISQSSPDDWLIYLYNYALNKNFKDAVTIELNPNFNISCEVYFKIYKILCDLEKSMDIPDNWQCKYPLLPLSDDEINCLERKDEYLKFSKSFDKDYVYEMMKLNGAIFKYNTLDHICGVHYLAMFLARQLKAKGLPLDLGRVSGSATGHDIGKYGCKGEELKRVPHLHYYYTDQWFKNRGINYIRNIAINHSTWDLELENLSLESLILIYCDFRVKNILTKNGSQMCIFTLAESFNVILEKLENIDIQKENRYRRVYEKLKDFEGYLTSIDISTDPSSTANSSAPIVLPTYSLLHGNDITMNMKYSSINHNINLMYLLRDEYSLNTILEQGRSETDWKNLRQYIRVLDEYCTYFTQKQKLQTLKFLYDHLTHGEDDIRRHSAYLIGKIISIFDEDYSKEMPKNVIIEKPLISSYDIFEEYLNLMLYPSSTLVDTHKNWIGYNTKIMVKSVFSNTRKLTMQSYRNIILKFYSLETSNTADTMLYLLDTSKYISLESYDEDINFLVEFILKLITKRNIVIRLAALDSLIDIIPKLPTDHSIKGFIIKSLESVSIKIKTPSENFLYLKIFTLLSMNELKSIFENHCINDYSKVHEIFLSNLKTATNWVVKKHQIHILLNITLTNAPNTALHTCIHFCNLLKVSEIETVRNKAGSSILKIMPILSATERNEVAIELLRGLEIEGQKFTEYIPPFLGQIILWLDPSEIDEIIDDLKFKIKTSNDDVKILILKTIGISLSNYSEYKSRFKEESQVYDTRLSQMLSILLNGIGDYKDKVKQAAIITLGKDIFGNSNLSLEKKLHVFKLSAKKILTLIANDANNQLLLLTNAAALNHIYRFIADYTFFNGYFSIDIPDKVAFFPGTFDPFSLGHKNIAKGIRDLGFEVYLAVDEFSWSKKTLPNLLRKTLISLSICDEFNIYIYPETLQTNIANPSDLKNLKNSFPGSDVYFVSGSDVLLNSSCYKLPASEDSIHTFNHIIFERGNAKKLQESKSLIKGKVEILNLPLKYSNISSSQIRSYIDKNRDISTLVDPLVSKYIHENGFYQREPLDKLSLNASNLDFNFIETINSSTVSTLLSMMDFNADLEIVLTNLITKEAPKLVIIKDSKHGGILALAAMHWVRANNMYSEVNNEEISRTIRTNSSGRMIFIDGIYVSDREKNKFLEQIILTESLAFAISKDYEYAVFNPKYSSLTSPLLVETMMSQGFIDISLSNSTLPILTVSMTSPCVLNLDIENIIKEPFRSNPKVKSVINIRRKLLQKSLSDLYPHELLLCFNSEVLHERMIKSICYENQVSTHIKTPKEYGSAMCVPYGDILDRYVVPNTVTKSLHTEKYYSGDMKDFFIGESPYYLSLKNQLKMIKSFNRPILLVDNILHKGYRIRALDPLLKEENIDVQKILCGILSGRGKDLMDMQNREVASVYFIPKLKIWFNENNMYPFLGGDAIWRGSFPTRNLIPSINAILPYTYPLFINDTTHQSIYNLSKVCLDTSIEILKILESEYHHQYGRNLTLHSLGEVITIPRSPDIGKGIEYDLSKAPSTLVEKDLELLTRLENIL
ncbi:MAG: cytidyltransferase [Clostridium sp.]|uniref:nicotinate-nicotinamide nucleotide adenylyltransferase n=1 Tax=Clostridium sp. TaxID=1506 RepID=UPI003058658C